MRVKINQLKPNPFRNIEKYPVDRMKVDALKASISETTFWDNIVARQKNGFYEIAYGHHRLIALQELKIDEIDIPIKDIDNATMIRIMANENMEYWKYDLAVRVETVRAVRNFLNTELAKYDSWEDACANKSIITKLVDNAKGNE